MTPPTNSTSDEVSMNTLASKFKLATMLWGRTTRRMRYTSAIIIFLILFASLSFPALQNADISHIHPINPDYSQNRSQYNESKVALLIENRPFPILAPLMLHFMAVMPPDWRFRFMGSPESVEHITRSVAILHQVLAGKLDITYIPSNMTTGSQEEISRFLTNLWLYETVLQPAEWLLIFQTDSIICANSDKSLDDFLEYDWVGAPWNPEGKYGGNGGLSLRRVSAIIDVLRNQKRVDWSEPEDVWLTERLAHRIGSKIANGTVSLKFSGENHQGEKVQLIQEDDNKYNSTLDALEHGEYVKGIDDFREGFYEPLGYHTGGSGANLNSGIWGEAEQRKHIWEYCPEVKMTMKMDAAKFVPGDCNNAWKRDLSRVDSAQFDSNPELDLGWGTEIIDGKEYPLLPPNIVPW